MAAKPVAGATKDCLELEQSKKENPRPAQLSDWSEPRQEAGDPHASLDHGSAEEIAARIRVADEGLLAQPQNKQRVMRV